MNRGNFYISSDVIFALLAVVLLLIVLFMKIPLPYIDASHLLFFVIIILIARAFLPTQLIGWIIGLLLIIYILQFFVTAIPFAPLIVALLLLFLILGIFFH